MISEDELFLNITGTIELINSFGYLNAEQYPLLTYYLWMGLIYGLIGMLWTYFMLHHKTQIIALHYFITLIFVLCIFECLLMFLEYSVFNTLGTRYFLFVAISIVFSALRNTLARVLTLTVSLG